MQNDKDIQALIEATRLNTEASLAETAKLQALYDAFAAKGQRDQEILDGIAELREMIIEQRGVNAAIVEYIAESSAGDKRQLLDLRKKVNGFALKQGKTQVLSETDLRLRLVEQYDEEELRTLCFDLGVDYDTLRGEGKEGKARELVAALKRRGSLGVLADRVGG